MSTQGALRLQADDRFERLRHIPWWDQDRLSQAKVLVLGTGALGNEILKNLSLMGVGNIFIADRDTIESSNLSRSILFRERHAGQPKAVVAAEAVHDIYPQCNLQSFVGDVIYDLGLGVYVWADLVVAGMDNREARLWINRYCWKTGKPWIDGATEVLQGVARVFVPRAGACFECTMSDADWTVIRERRGCENLKRDGLPDLRIPTTPVTASIIAALQCQEVVKLLYGMEGLASQGMVFDGLANLTYVVRYNENPECISHEPIDQIVALPESVRNTTVTELVNRATSDLGPGAGIDLHQELLTNFVCPVCQTSQPVFRPLGSVSEKLATCPECNKLRRAESTKLLLGTEPFAGKKLAEIGVPLFDVVVARKGDRRIGYQFMADAPAVLGPLWRTS